MMSFLAFFLFLSFMPESLNLLDTNSYIEKCLLLFFYCLSHFISIEDPELIQSEMILSFLYPQFNIDVYIPLYIIHAPLSFLSFFSCNLKYSNGRFFLFFSSYLLFFRLKTEESFIMIWIAFIWITPFSFFFLILFFSFAFPFFSFP